MKHLSDFFSKEEITLMEIKEKEFKKKYTASFKIFIFSSLIGIIGVPGFFLLVFAILSIGGPPHTFWSGMTIAMVISFPISVAFLIFGAVFLIISGIYKIKYEII